MICPSDSITLDAVLAESIEILMPVFPETARDETYRIMADYLSVPFSRLRTDRDRMTVTCGQKEEMIKRVNRRAKREPPQYLAKTACFMGETFRVGKGVLIPRNDTEILVEEALRIASAIPGDFRFFEFCTGSGCIALSFLKKMREAGRTARGVATDLSPDALDYAAENAISLGCTDRIRLVEWDMFSSPLPVEEAKFEMILANPPYIRTNIIATLEPEVSLYEPMIALDGGPDGLRFYRRILACAEELLAPDGWILLEIGYDQEQEVRSMVERTGCYGQIGCVRDYGGNPRVIAARRMEGTDGEQI